ncbi:glycosyltransferase family 2 protein [Apibacter adventoris]|uniref:Glycosyltransferase 2-like domain-containing protein n=1 Tax=Apibacter adventoris TaxID=1679466 RepID=A0A2S8AGH6_9FLAO|nr:glycosyltransferase family 2 protein [Apibacter adventoris]PQL95491.1 hypothetical protein C4S77_01470 [Apibacter adventoris]
MNKVYIILLNFNGHSDTIECLESLFKINYSNYQIIIIDNSNTLDSVTHIIDWIQKGESELETYFSALVYPLVKKPLDFVFLSEDTFTSKKYDNKLLIVKAKKNKGFSAGNNIALRYILKYGEKNSFSWLLNNDTVVLKNTLRELIAYYTKSKKKLGILGAKLVCYNKPNRVQAIGGKFSKLFYMPFLIGEGIGINQVISNVDIDYAIGASLFVSSEFLHNVGILSEDYFLYYEELDWSYRASLLGWKTDLCFDAIVYHKEGKSIGTSSDHKKRSLFSQYHMFRSRRIFCSKYYKISFKFYLSTILISLNRLRHLNFSEFKIVINSLRKTP